ncbi:transposase [Streptomyces sp. YIM 121038]|uniref:transposase n=1 Tax=Streptomyces sp. YIM 121038 TaxID=2136401 RepID=UPI0011109DFF|nr:transposase [Streptomyces sp. YIM 121038]
MAKGVMRRKPDTLVEALTGSLGEHQAFLARTMLDRIDACTATENRLSDHIDQQMAPFHRRVELLVTIHGVSTRAAEVIFAEIGADITRFPTGRGPGLVGGVCPGNRESVGK